MTITAVWSVLGPTLAAADALENAAQTMSSALYDRFQESLVLIRIFTTVEYGALPASNQEFVQTLAGSPVAADVPVLSLIGTSGERAPWRNRRKSEGHVGIPLISSEFVGAIPMIARLIHELGIPMDWIDTRESDLIQETIGNSEGLFYVADAAEAVDSEGRKIIAAQDFVHEYRVKSVFGVGTAYPNSQLAVLVAFCRCAFERSAAEHFLPLMSLFKGATGRVVDEGRIFVD